MSVFFKGPAEAWHEVFASKSIQDQFSERTASSTSTKTLQDARQAELAKVYHAIKDLPDHQRDAGNYCCHPDCDAKTLERIRQRSFDLMLGLSEGTKFWRYFHQTAKALILINLAIEEGRFRALNPTEPGRQTKASMAAHLGIAHTSYIRTWEPYFEQLCDQLKGDAIEALEAVGAVVDEINARNRKAS